MSVSLVKSGPLRSEIRVWLNANGHPQGARGRFTPAGIEAYNAANPRAKYDAKGTTPAFVKTVVIVAKPEKGRSVSRTLNIGQVRAALALAGTPVGKRGRISKAVLSSYVLASAGK